MPKAKVAPVSTKHAGEFDASAQRIGQPRSAQIALEGPAEIDRDDIQIIPALRFKDKAATEAFMAEMITIRIETSGEQYPENPVQLGVNGRNAFVWRNMPTIIARKYVERLARARSEGINQDPANPDPKIANKLNITSGLKYPFTVLEDKNPLGKEWLARILQEA